MSSPPGGSTLRCVYMSPSVTALALRAGAVGDGDVLIFSFVNFGRFENVNVLF